MHIAVRGPSKYFLTGFGGGSTCSANDHGYFSLDFYMVSDTIMWLILIYPIGKRSHSYAPRNNAVCAHERI
ncbi:hypothetical protein BH20ACI2_BH20ACI2_17840 [soil metagenome]